MQKLQISSFILVILLLITSSTFLIKGPPEFLDSMELAGTNIFLWFFFILSLVWTLLFIYSFIKKTDNDYVINSAELNIFIFILGAIIVIVNLMTLSWENGLWLNTENPFVFMMPFMVRGSLISFFFFLPIILLIPFIAFVMGQFQE